MKFGASEETVGIFKELAERKRLLGREAARYPLDRAAYKQLSLPERMQIAERLVALYTPQDDGGPSPRHEPPATHRQEATAEFEVEDHPGMLLKGTVYSEVSPPSRGTLRGMFVMAQAVDSVANLTSSAVPFGAVLAGRERAILDPDRNWDGRGVPLENPAAANLVAVIDEAAVGLLEGVVRDHRRYLGQQAMPEGPLA